MGKYTFFDENTEGGCCIKIRIIETVVFYNLKTIRVHRFQITFAVRVPNVVKV